jgi:hypothetical protein
MIRFLVVALSCLFVAGVSYAAPDAAPDAKVVTDGAVTVVDAAAVAPKTPAVPKTLAEGVETVKQTVAWFQQEHWRAAIAGIIALLVGVWRRFDKKVIAKVPKKALPFVAGGVALLAALPMALMIEPLVVEDVLDARLRDER